MYHQFSRWAACLALAAAAPWTFAQAAWPVAAPAGPVVDAGAATIDLSALAATWIDAGGTATADQVAQGRGDFRVPRGRMIQPTGAGRALWLKMTLRRGAGSATGDWVLQVPMPVVDSVTVYLRDAGGAWKPQSAGDTLDVATWPEPGRFPFFRIPLAPDESRPVLVRVVHSTPVSLPVRLVPIASHDSRTQVEYLGLGAVFGAILVVLALCAYRGVTLRDAGYAWYTLYAGASLLATAAFTGVGAQWLWPGATRWADAAPGLLAILAGSAALLIVRSLSGIVTRHKVLDRLILGAAVAGPVLAATYFLLQRPHGVAMLGLFLVVVAVLSLAAATIVWRRGDEVGVWMMGGALPLALAVMLVMCSVFGWIQASWITEYSLVSGIALGLPTLFGALHNRSRERRGAEFRQRASSSQDALTGLLTARVFEARLAQAIRRYRKHQEGAAVMLIELANHAWIKETQGSAVAEQCLLRSVILLRRLVRDVDATGRLGESRFGLLLEGIDSRAIVTDRATRLLAAGLRPPAQGNAEVTLQFHVAAALLDEYAQEPAAMVFALGDVLSSMSARTRHPIRFVDGNPQSSRPEAAAIMHA